MSTQSLQKRINFWLKGIPETWNGTMNNKREIRRLFDKAQERLSSLDLALFTVGEADVLELDENEQREKSRDLLTEATDCLDALVSIDLVGNDLRQEVRDALLKAKNNPYEITELSSDSMYEPGDEAFLHVLVLRTLLSRLGAVLGLQDDKRGSTITESREHLLEICHNIGDSVKELVGKKIVSIPETEHHFKHLLFATARASFRDAVPDGGITFRTVLKGHKPDFGIPRLKSCVETKVARTKPDLATVINELLADMSTYGSKDYEHFIAVIYTNNEEISQQVVEEEFETRHANLGSALKYHWQCVVTQGLLSPKKKRD